MITRLKSEDAIGLTLAHDITKVQPGVFKGPLFKRGHVICREDLPALLDIGKEHVFVIHLEKDEVHEEDAALRIAHAIAGPGLDFTRPSEGRVDLFARQKGLLKINVPVLERLNTLEDIIISTIHNNTVCKEGLRVAGMRIIPLSIKEQKLAYLEQMAKEYYPVIQVKPMQTKKVGLVVTGTEVFKGRVADGFSPVMHRKIEAFGCVVNNERVVPDDPDLIARAILDFKNTESEIVLCCSGMSVDPDDVTPTGIRRSGAEVIFYGLPVLAGAMLLYARLGGTPVLGIPACVLHAPTTGFDLLFPRILAGEDLTYLETRKLGHGSLCLKCEKCTYPVCPFGK